MRSYRSTLSSIIVAGLCSGGVLMAQQSSSTIKGRVVDAGTGAGKAGVLVTVTNPNTGVTRSVVTEGKGLFAFPFLPVAQYQITYSLNGQTYKASRAALLGQEVDASFKWPVNVAATVEVVATTSLAQSVDTTTAQMGTAVDAELISSLPIVGRDINQAAVLAPGVSIVSGSNVDPTKKTSSYIVAGDGMGRGTNYAVDGADNNSTDVGGSVMPVPFDAVQEFQVVTNQVKAEFGKSTQGFFNVLTKSGTNEFTGVVSGQWTNQALRARRSDEAVKSDDSQWTMAGTVGGPIIKDKLFFMVSAEETRGKGVPFDFQPSSIAIDPTLAGIQYQLTKKNVLTKIDWNPFQRLTTSWTYQFYQDETKNQPFPRTNSYNGNVPSAALGTGKNKSWAVGNKITFTILDNLVWESNMHYFDYRNGINPNGAGPANGSALAVRNVSGTVEGHHVDNSALGWGGLDPNALQNTGIKRFQWKNDLLWINGDHNIKAGFDYMHSVYADQQLFFGETSVYSMRVNGPGINYLNAYSSAVINESNVDQTVVGVTLVPNGFQPGTSFNQYGAFLQDDWNVNSKLSLYGGVRVDWDTQLSYMKQFDGLYAEERANTLAEDPTATPGYNSGRAPRGKAYIQPRFQAVYKPDGSDKLSLKFGAGYFVAQVIDNVTGSSRQMLSKSNGLPAGYIYNETALAATGASSPSASSSVTSFAKDAYFATINGNDLYLPAALTPYNYANNVNGLRDFFRYTVNGYLTSATANTGGKNLLASDFQYPTQTTFNLGVAYRLSDHQAVEANLVYSKSRHLTTQILLDGAGPETKAYDADGNALGDNVFYSNQTASSLALQMKWNYSTSNTSLTATLVVKNDKSSEGGAAGAFDASGATGGLYGEGASYGWKATSERRSPGSATFSGSFNVAHRFDWGTAVSLLGTWHSGRAYDIFMTNSEADSYNPSYQLGYKEGCWAMNLDLKVSHKFEFGHKLALEPYIAIQNLLNQYDYGSNYDGQVGTYTPSEPISSTNPDYNTEYRSRGAAYAANNPRNAAFGFRFTF